jgi:hypothetical protein
LLPEGQLFNHLRRVIGALQSLRCGHSSPSAARRRLTKGTLKRRPVAASISAAISLLV